MFLLSSFVRIYPLILPAILLFQVGGSTAVYRVSQQAETPSGVPQVSLAIWTDRAKYSLRDGIQVNGALRNDGNEPAYVDRRISWAPAPGSLELEIRDQG